MTSLSTRPIFGLSAPALPWTTPGFQHLDDRDAQGGLSSSAYSRVVEGLGFLFDGYVTPTPIPGNTTGGVFGYASQVSTAPHAGIPFELDADHYSGLELTVTWAGSLSGKRQSTRPITNPPNHSDDLVGRQVTAEVRVPGLIDTYSVYLQNEPLVHYDNGSYKAPLMYEFAFTLSKGENQTQDEFGRKKGSFTAKWEDFKPKINGIPQANAPALNVSDINYLYILAAANFGEQIGPFSLALESLSAVVRPGSETPKERSIAGRIKAMF